MVRLISIEFLGFQYDAFVLRARLYGLESMEMKVLFPPFPKETYLVQLKMLQKHLIFKRIFYAGSESRISPPLFKTVSAEVETQDVHK